MRQRRQAGCVGAAMTCLSLIMACVLSGFVAQQNRVIPPRFSLGIGPVGIAAQQALVDPCQPNAACTTPVNATPRRWVYAIGVIIKGDGRSFPRRYFVLHIPLRS